MARLAPWLILLSLAQTPAWADDMRQGNVTGWSPVAKGGAQVMVYTHDGEPHGVQNLSAVMIAGVHPWNLDYDIVDLGGDRWVERKNLNIALCGNLPPQSPHNVIASGSSRPKASTGYGSGAPCR